MHDYCDPAGERCPVRDLHPRTLNTQERKVVNIDRILRLASGVSQAQGGRGPRTPHFTDEDTSWGRWEVVQTEPVSRPEQGCLLRRPGPPHRAHATLG